MQWNGASCCELVEKSMETETTTWSEFPNGGKAIVEQILAKYFIVNKITRRFVAMELCDVKLKKGPWFYKYYYLYVNIMVS